MSYSEANNKADIKSISFCLCMTENFSEFIVLVILKSSHFYFAT
jgi:hypothetical protein